MVLCAIVFSVLYAVKGGQHGHLKVFSTLRRRSKILDRILDGKVLSTIGVLLFSLFAGIDNAIALSALWLLAIAPSMGEEAGAVGGFKGGWGPYIEKGFGRDYGVKKALQRGVFSGACLAIATGSVMPIIAGALFVPAYWVGISIQQSRTGSVVADWNVSELIFGVCLGIGIAAATS